MQRLAVAVVLAAISLPAAAQANDAAGPRLSGQWRVTIADIKAHNVTGAPTTVRRRWRFLALCDTGACAVQLRRRVNGVIREMRLRLRHGVYVGRDTYLLPLTCEGRVVPDSVSWVNRFRLRVTGWQRRPDGTRIATHFRGRLRSVSTPTQRAPQKCRSKGLLVSKATGRRA
jgi:hypothetical protein